MGVTGYSGGWIQQLARRYNARGPEALGDRRHHNPGARDRALLGADQRGELAEALKGPPPDGGMWNPRKVGEWIEQETGRALAAGSKKQGGRDYLKRLGEIARRFPGLATRRPTSTTRRLSKKAPDEGSEAQGGLPDGEGGVAWCEDEHRLGLKPIVRKVWGPIGERPIVGVHRRYEWTYLYAFARPDTGGVFWLILPTVNAEAFSIALEHFAREV